MTNIDIDLSGFEFDLPEERNPFEPITDGEHAAFVENVELTESKAGKPMLVVDWKIADNLPDGTPDADAGKTATSRYVLVVKTKNHPHPQLHWLLPPYFRAVGMWEEDPDKRKVMFSKDRINQTFASLIEKLDGCEGTVKVTNTPGNPITDSMGAPVLNEDGTERRYTNTDVAMLTLAPKKARKRKLA